jgi:dTMP kinase
MEGIDGCGKGTQIALLEETLKKNRIDYVKVRDPGGPGISEEIRKILLDPAHKGEMANITELMLYSAARAQLTEEVIKPALEQGKAVLADRFVFSTLAYQGYGRGQDLAMIKDLIRISNKGCLPDITFILDVPVEVGRERQSKDKARSGPDRLEQEKNEFFERVRNGYRLIAEKPDLCLPELVDATMTPELVHEKIVEALGLD